MKFSTYFVRLLMGKRPGEQPGNECDRLASHQGRYTKTEIITGLSLLLMLFLGSCSDDCPTCPDRNPTPPVSEKPTAIFDIIPVNNSFHALDTLLFDASRSQPGDFGPLKYYWDFGDSTTDSGLTARQIYKDEGQYGVSLIVTDTLGFGDTCKSILSIWSPFARSEFEILVIREDGDWGRSFLVIVESHLDYFPPGQYDLAFDILEADGSEVPFVLNRSAGINVTTTHTTAIDTFDYSPLAGVWWPDDSAMFIISMWKDGIGYTRVAVDSLIAYYPAVPSTGQTTLETSFLKEGSGLNRTFTVTVGVQMKNYLAGDYSLEVDVRRATGGHLLLGHREHEFDITGTSFADTSIFVYDALSGALWWPTDSAMVISSIWKQMSLISKTKIAADTIIARY